MKRLIIALLAVSIVAIAKTEHAPLPDAVLKAKTIFIDNQSGYADIADKVYSEFKKWGRFEITNDRKAADMVVLLSAREYHGFVHTGGTATTTGDTTNYSSYSVPTRTGYTYITLVEPSSGQNLWSDGRRWHAFGSASRDVVKELRKRIEEQESKTH